MKTNKENKIITKAYTRWLKACNVGVNTGSLKMPYNIIKHTAGQVSEEDIKAIETDDILKNTFLLALLRIQHKERKISY